MAGCGAAPFEVIEELEFAETLEIDLEAYEKLTSGLYTLDVIVGEGETLSEGMNVTVGYTAWLADGTQVGQGSFSFVIGTGTVIAGFDEGVRGMQIGGVRRLIVPAELGYGEEEKDEIPAGSVLVFEIDARSNESDSLA